jgi:hypothetical protein
MGPRPKQKHAFTRTAKKLGLSSLEPNPVASPGKPDFSSNTEPLKNPSASASVLCARQY